VVAALARLALQHERDIQDVKDLHDYIILVRGQDLKQRLDQAKQQWTQDKPEAGPHPKGSQRALLFAVIGVGLHRLLTQAADVPGPVMQAMQFLITQGAEQLDRNIFRLQSRHRTPVDDMPWVWQLTVSPNSSADFREAIYLLTHCHQLHSILKEAAVEMQPPRSGPRSGPLVQQLQAFLQGGEPKSKKQRRGRGGA
jgi:hypothetical protein